MLARIAHELYWIGRYVARADDTARMLDGLFRASLQSPGGSGATDGAAAAAGRPLGRGQVGAAGQLGAAVAAPGHEQRRRPAQPLVQMEDDPVAHRRPPPMA